MLWDNDKVISAVRLQGGEMVTSPLSWIATTSWCMHCASTAGHQGRVEGGMAYMEANLGCSIALLINRLINDYRR